jgi:hypothetical protein
VEYCTSIKALAFQHFFRDDVIRDAVFLDPDVKVYGAFNSVMKGLETNDIVLTPHICSVDLSDDFKLTRETKFLSVGVFNLGFIGLRNSEGVKHFLQWWDQRLIEYCYLNPAKGQFVDQNWMNFVPVFFEKVGILKDLGLNIAYWNYRERKTFLEENKKEVCFVHFSARTNFRDLPLLDHYLDDYETSLAAMDSVLKKNKLVFQPAKKNEKDRSRRSLLGRVFNKIVNVI